MRQLLWKEWHEQWWKLALCSLVLGTVALVGLHARMVADQTMVLWVCTVGMVMLPVLVSSGLIAFERSAGSFETLLALPIAPWRILLVKTAAGAVLCVGPLATALLISLAVAGGREMPDRDMLWLYGGTMLATVSLLLWMLAATARLPSEARAALVALGVLICWGVLSIWLSSPEHAHGLFSISPFGLLRDPGSSDELIPNFWMTIAVQTATWVVLWVVTLFTFTVSPRGG